MRQTRRRSYIFSVPTRSLTMIAFDGHVYSLKLIPSSVFVSFSLACATELPAGLLLTLLLDRWGRRFCGFITLAMTCLFSFAELLLQSSEHIHTGFQMCLSNKIKWSVTMPRSLISCVFIIQPQRSWRCRCSRDFAWIWQPTWACSTPPSYCRPPSGRKASRWSIFLA